MKLLRIGSTAVVAAGVLALASCAGGPAANGGGDTSTLTIAAQSGNQVPLDAVIAAFEEQNEGVTVNVNYAGTEQLQSTLRTQLSSGTGPDVFTVWAGRGNPAAVEVLQEAGYLADLSDSEWAAQVPESIAAQIQIDGKTYGLPSRLDAIGAIYNADLLDELGLEIPSTYSELLAFCGDVAEAGKVAFALGVQTPWVGQLITYAQAAGTVYAEDPDFDDRMTAGETSFGESGWVTALEHYLEMDEAGCFQENPAGTTVEATYDQIAAGDALAAVQVVAQYAQLAGQAEGTRFGFFTLPSADDEADNLTPIGIGLSFALNAEADNPELGRAFIDFLGSEEGRRIFAEAGDNLPVIPVEGLELNPVLTTVQDIINSGSVAPFPDPSWPNARVQEEHLVGVQELFSGQAEIDDVLTAMDAAYAG